MSRPLPPLSSPIANADGSLATPYRLLLADLAQAEAGWAAATGTASRATFDTATVTTAQLAQRVKALIDDLIARGVLSA